VQPDPFRSINGSRLARVPIWLAGADCEGTEERLAACAGVTLENVSARCTHSQDLRILCFNGPDAGAPASLAQVHPARMHRHVHLASWSCMAHVRRVRC